MTYGISDLPFRDWKNGQAWWCDRRWWFDKHGDVKMVLEQVSGFNCGFVAAADENDAAALQFDERYRRRRFGRRSKQRRHLWPRPGSIARPSGRLPNIGKVDRTGSSSFCR